MPNTPRCRAKHPSSKHPPLDHDMAPHVAALAARREPLTRASLAARRRHRRCQPNTARLVADMGTDLTAEDITIPGPPGAAPLAGTIIRPRSRTAVCTVINWHGGGFVSGHRSRDTVRLAWIARAGAAVLNMDYRLAPEHPYPAAHEDAYAALTWAGHNSARLYARPGRIVLLGTSAGAGLAAGVALMARDRGGPDVLGALLLAPMLDDRQHTPSHRQVPPTASTWTAEDNATAWRCLLGDAAGGPNVPAYAAPGRATDLTGFPRSYIEAPAADIFCDDAVAFEGRLRRNGVAVDLRVLGGCPHGFDTLAKSAWAARSARRTRAEWLDRLLALPG